MIADRRREVMDALDAIQDPCSVTMGHPIGLVGMGIVDEVLVVGRAVTVVLLPTFPDCLFRGVFEARIEERLRGLDWCTGVSVSFREGDASWDESRMAPGALAALRASRAARRAQ